MAGRATDALAAGIAHGISEPRLHVTHMLLRRGDMMKAEKLARHSFTCLAHAAGCRRRVYYQLCSGDNVISLAHWPATATPASARCDFNGEIFAISHIHRFRQQQMRQALGMTGGGRFDPRHDARANRKYADCAEKCAPVSTVIKSRRA